MSKQPAKRSAKRKAIDAIAGACAGMDAPGALLPSIDLSSKAGAKKKAAGTIADASNERNALIASLDLSSNMPPRNIADALLSLLPQGATRQHPSSKKLVKAFPLVIAALENRSNLLSRKSETQGQHSQLAFRFPTKGDGKQGEQFTTIQCPEDTFVNILKYLQGREIVSTSLVCKSWLVTSRLPGLWGKLDDACGLTNKSRKLNVTTFLKLLARPQFSCLKHIKMPLHSFQLSKTSISKMSKLLPHLETLEMPEIWSTGPKMKDEHIVAIAENFMNLKSIRNIEMWSISNIGIANMAQILGGGKLLDLRIYGSINHLADSGLSAIANSCQNLKHFAYKILWRYHIGRDDLSGGGIVDLFRKCRRLEIVELKDARRLTKEHCEEILTMVEEGEEGDFALRRINLEGGYPFIIKEHPFRIVDKDTLYQHF